MNRVQLSWANLASFDENKAEHRRAGRIACDRLECDQGRVLDLSRSGARIRIKSWAQPKKGHARSLLLITCSGETAEFPCRVAWVRKVFWNRYEVGVEFVGLSDIAQATLSAIATMHTDRSWIHDPNSRAA